MPTFEIELEDGRKYDLEAERQPTPEEAAEAINGFQNDRSSPLGAGLRSALRGVGPAFGGGRLGAMIGGAAGGALEGAILGSEVPVWGNIIGGLIGAGTFMWAAGKAQEKLADVISPSESNPFSTASQQKDYKDQSLASKVGGLAIFRLNPMKLGRALTGALSTEGRALVSEGFQLAKKAKTANSLTDRQAQALKAFNDVAEVAGNIGIGGGMGAVQGEDLQGVLKSAGIGALFNDSWLHGHTTPVHEVADHPAANGTTYPKEPARLGWTPDTIVTPGTESAARAAELSVPLTQAETQRLQFLRQIKENWPVEQGTVFDRELSDLEARAQANPTPPLGLPAPAAEPIVTPQATEAATEAALKSPLSNPERERLESLRRLRENWPVPQPELEQEFQVLDARDRRQAQSINAPAIEDPSTPFKAAMEPVKDVIPAISGVSPPDLNAPKQNPATGVYPMAPERTTSATERLAAAAPAKPFSPEQKAKAAKLKADLEVQRIDAEAKDAAEKMAQAAQNPDVSPDVVVAAHEALGKNAVEQAREVQTEAAKEELKQAEVQANELQAAKEKAASELKKFLEKTNKPANETTPTTTPEKPEANKPAEVQPTSELATDKPVVTEPPVVAPETNAAASEAPKAPEVAPEPPLAPAASQLTERNATLPDGRKFTDDGTGWQNIKTKNKVSNKKLIKQLDELSAKAESPAKPLEPTAPEPPAKAPEQAVASEAVEKTDPTDPSRTISTNEAGEEVHESKKNTASAGMKRNDVETHLESKGVDKSKVKAVSAPTGNWDGRSVFNKDGSLKHIEINSAKVDTPADIDRVLNHELAHVVTNRGELDHIIEALTPAEKKKIMADIVRLKYDKDTVDKERKARSVELLAEAWKGRSSYEKMIGSVRALFAKAGVKVSRRAAEKIAAESLADAMLRIKTPVAPMSQSTDEGFEEGPYGTRSRDIDERRRQEGRSDIPSQGTHRGHTEEELNAAKAELASDPDLMERRGQEIQKTGSAGPRDVVLLSAALGNAESAYREATEVLENKGASKEAKEEASKKFADSMTRLNHYEFLRKFVGGVFHQLGMKMQGKINLMKYSIRGMENRWIAAKGGESLNPREKAEISRMSRRYEMANEVYESRTLPPDKLWAKLEKRFPDLSKEERKYIEDAIEWREKTEILINADLERNKISDTEAEILLGRAGKEFDGAIEKVRISRLPTFERAADALVKWQRSMFLLGGSIFGKLTQAANVRLIQNVVEELIGGGVSKLIPKVASRAYLEGGSNPLGMFRSLGKSVEQLRSGEKIGKSFMEHFQDIIKETKRNTKAIMKTGASDMDILSGGKRDYDQAEWNNVLGRSHSVIKDPIKRAAYGSAMEKMVEAARRSGVEVTPELMGKFHAVAYEHSLRSIFMSSAPVVDGFNALIKTWERSDSVPTKLMARALRILVPFTTVPFNIVAEGTQMATGLPIGMVKLAKIWHKGMDSLSTQEADIVMRQLKKGSLGAALATLAFLAPQAIGGFYQEGEKRKRGDVKPGSIKIGDVDIPHWLMHAPAFEVLQFGATMRRTMDSVDKHGEMRGPLAGAMAGAMGLAQDTPFVNEMFRMKELQGPDGRSKFFNELAKGLVEPTVLQEIARGMDDRPRKPEGLWETFKSGVPGLRDEVTVKVGDFLPPSEKEMDPRIHKYSMEGNPVPSTPSRDDLLHKNPNLSNEKWARYTEVRGRLIKQKLLSAMSELRRLSLEEKKAVVNHISREATEQAKESLHLK